MIYEGQYVFQIGPTPDGRHQAIVRIGGHLETGETPFECACREAMEEAMVSIEYIEPEATFYINADDDGQKIVLGRSPSPEPEYKPLLTVTSVASLEMGPSYTFMTKTRMSPRPSSETKALILLDKNALAALDDCTRTLAELLGIGARLIEREHLDPQLPIRPFIQAKFLSRLIG